MDQAITRAPAAPRLVGEFQGYIDGVEPSVTWADRKNMPQVGDKLYALPARAAVPRTWALLLTSQNHGVVGAAGSQFESVPENYERVQVMEIVEAGAAPAPGTDLPGLVRLPLTNEQIAAGAAIECDHGAPIGRNAAIDVFDAMSGAASPVAAQAGQVAVPEGWRLVPAQPNAAMLKAGAESEDKDFGLIIHNVYCSMLAAAPSAPAVAQQAPSNWISVDDRLPEGRYCLATYRDRAGKLRIIRAMYLRQFEIEADGDECDSETNEANGLEYLKAGWYEMIDNWGEYSSVHVCEGPVTHWQPLPVLPGAQASTPDGRESTS